MKVDPVAAVLLIAVAFVMLVGTVNFIDNAAEIGACGYGPAAPANGVCTDR